MTERIAQWRDSQDVRRLVSCLVIGLAASLMTGSPGSINAPTAGLSAALLHPRVIVFLALGAGLWALLTTWERNAAVRERAHASSALITSVFEDRRVRLSSYGALIVVAIALPPMLSVYWQE